MEEKLTTEVISKLFETLVKLRINSEAYGRFRQSIINDLIRLGFTEERAVQVCDEMESAYNKNPKAQK